MPYTILQGGTSLQSMTTAGALTTLTLPTGVKLDSSLRPRFAVFGRYVVMVNSPTRPLTIDTEGTVRLLCPHAPRTKPTLTTGTGALTGDYLVRQSFIVLDADGNIIAESEMGTPSLSGAVSAQALVVASLDLCTDTVSATRLYRTTDDGSVYFPWFDLDGNTQTQGQDDLSDAGLQLVAAPSLGTPPDLVLIAEFRERLWGRSLTDIDYLRYTETGKMYAWPTANTILVPRLGSDDRGITGIIPRRESLLVGRQDRLFQITGTSNTDFRAVKLKENVGIESADSVVVYNDIAYWLADDGVYTASEGGRIESLTAGKVSSWFQTDTYFNRSRFQYAVGRVDPLRNKYQLLLSNTGDSTDNRWIEMDLTDHTWWGPHKTDDFTPSWMGVWLDSNGLTVPALGSTTGFIYKDQATRTDGTATAIDLDVDTKFHDGNTPDIHKSFLEPTVISRIQAAGTLTMTPYVGGLDASAGTAISVDMTLGRQRLRRLGDGRFVRFNLRHTTAGQDVELYGIEIPWFERGRR